MSVTSDDHENFKNLINELPTPSSSSGPSSRNNNGSGSGGGGMRVITRDRIGPIRRPTASSRYNVPTSHSSSSSSIASSRYRMTLRQSLPLLNGGGGGGDSAPAGSNTSTNSSNSNYARERRPLLQYYNGSDNASSTQSSTHSEAAGSITNNHDNTTTNNTNNDHDAQSIISQAAQSIISTYGGLHLPTMTLRIASLFCLLSCLMIYSWISSTVGLNHDIATLESIRDVQERENVRTHVSDGRTRKYRENYAAAAAADGSKNYYPKIERKEDGSVSNIENIASGAAAGAGTSFGVYDGEEHQDEDEMMIMIPQNNNADEINHQEEMVVMEENEEDIAIRNKILEMAKLKEEEHMMATNTNTNGGLRGSSEEEGGEDGNVEDAEKSLLDASLAKLNAALDYDSQNSQDGTTIPGAKAPAKATVAYVLPIYSCYPTSSSYNTNDPYDDATFHDAALLLKQSIHLRSWKNKESESVYDYQMIAIMESSVVKCKDRNGKEGVDRAELLTTLGYEVLIKEEPISYSSINSDFLRLSIPNNGCCGTKELIRFYAYELEEYPVVVMIDFSTMVLKKPDDVYNLIVDGGSDDVLPDYMKEKDVWVKETRTMSQQIIIKEEFPKKVDVVYTRDYTTVMKGKWSTGVNLGFFVLRPSKQTFDEIVELYTKVDYTDKHGWGGKGYGPFVGSMLSKGFLTYYYHEVQSENVVELNRCKYQNMAEIPLIRLDKKNMQCRDAKETRDNCTDCRQTAFGDIVVANSKVCRSPWACHYHNPNVDSRVCHGMHKSWFQMRKDLEDDEASLYSPEERKGKYYPEHFMGYCRGGQRGEYVPMKQVREEKDQ